MAFVDTSTLKQCLKTLAMFQKEAVEASKKQLLTSLLRRDSSMKNTFA
jgi:hypothetical protein